jgi:hypothetical protein
MGGASARRWRGTGLRRWGPSCAQTDLRNVPEAKRFSVKERVPLRKQRPPFLEKRRKMGRAGSPFSGRTRPISGPRVCLLEELARRDHLWRSDPRIQHWESFEVLRDGKRKKFLFDISAFRRGISGRMSKDEAKQQALAFAQCTEDRIEIDPDEAAPPPWAE